MARESKARGVLRWAPSVIWMTVIFGFSSISGPELGPLSALSTLGHLGEYAILGILLFIAARKTWTPRVAAVFAIAVASAYGAGDELRQSLTPGRTPDIADWVTDTVGATAAVACFLLVKHLRTAREGLRDA